MSATNAKTGAVRKNGNGAAAKKNGNGAAARKNGNGDAASSEARYRDSITWDQVTWGTHCVDCYPGNCPWRVYVKDGVIMSEEQAGNLPAVEAGVPDMNPLGCQKGAAWSQLL
ncbi:MAG: hypothetical protein EPO22_04760, partial [Dehalococcoidia bacterium]